MPSRFEPSGLNQMYSQRYGTPPIVHATGGLLDSVVDCTRESLAIKRCAAIYDDAAVWRALQRNGMARDFSWNAAAREYATIYARMVAS